jgi:hypothetical protein
LIAGNVFSHQRELGEQKRERKTKGRKNWGDFVGILKVKGKKNEHAVTDISFSLGSSLWTAHICNCTSHLMSSAFQIIVKWIVLSSANLLLHPLHFFVNSPSFSSTLPHLPPEMPCDKMWPFLFVPISSIS